VGRSGGPAFETILIGIALVFFGFLLWNKLRTRSQKSTRFSRFRKQNWDEEDEQERDHGWD